MFYIALFFNRDLNRGCLVYLFSLRFSGIKFLINSGRQFRVRNFFSRRHVFTLRQFLRDLQSFHFAFKITKNVCIIQNYA